MDLNTLPKITKKRLTIEDANIIHYAISGGVILNIRFRGEELNADDLCEYDIVIGDIDYNKKYIVIHDRGYALHEHLLRMFGVPAVQDLIGQQCDVLYVGKHITDIIASSGITLNTDLLYRADDYYGRFLVIPLTEKNTINK